MASSSNFRMIILTGSPGIGKTTAVHKVCEVLKSKGIPTKGFYTQECRENRVRIGFDVVSFDGQRAPLARVGDTTCGSKNRVGKYTVLIPSFEQIALPLLSNEHTHEGNVATSRARTAVNQKMKMTDNAVTPLTLLVYDIKTTTSAVGDVNTARLNVAPPQTVAPGSSPVYVVDEVGKMELFSTGFRNAVSSLLRDKTVTLLATIPVKGSQTIPLVEEIRCHPNSCVYEITRENRDKVVDSIVSAVEKSFRGLSTSIRRNEAVLQAAADV